MRADTPHGPPNSYMTLESHATSFLAPSTVVPVLTDACAKMIFSSSLLDSLDVEETEVVRMGLMAEGRSLDELSLD